MKKIIPIFLIMVLMMILSITATAAGNGEKSNVLESELSTYDRLLKIANEMGAARIIVKLDVKDIKRLTERSNQFQTVEPGLKFPAAGVQADLELQQAIDATAYSVLYQLNGKSYQLNHIYTTIPYLALEVSPETLSLLPTLPQVLDIYEDKPRKLVDYPEEVKGALEEPFISSVNGCITQPMLNTSVAHIGAKRAWANGYTGAGWYVAILDTGIRKTHQFFTGKTIVEACFSANSDCPNRSTEMKGSGAAAHYESKYYGFDHGTHVSGIAAGKYGSLAGVAKDSNIIAVQIFSRFSPADCGGAPCVMSYDSDMTKGLEYIYSLRSTYSIAAVNISVGSGSYSSYCSGEPQKAAMDNLKAARIASIVASGNEGACGAVSSPACIPSAIAVGASDDSDVEAGFSNWHSSILKLFAPGVNINSSTGLSDSSYGSWDGTSMAAPHVTGAWALLRQANSSNTVDTILKALQETGPAIDNLCGSGGSCPRIQVDSAINYLQGNVSSILLTAPNGGEKWNANSVHAITWTSSGSVGNVKIELSTDNGSNWSTIIASTKNTGSYNWTVPNSPSTKCKVRIKEAADGVPSDTSNNVFSIAAGPAATLTVTSPNGGEKWDVGSVHNITWTTSGAVGNVKIEYSTNNGSSWTSVSSSTANDGSYSWTVPNTISSTCRVRISEASDGSPTDTSNAAFSIIKSVPPEISLNRTQYYYGSIVGGALTGPQILRIENKGGSKLQWTVQSDASWLTASPTSGTNAGEIEIYVSPGALAVGAYTGTISISAPGAVNSPQTVSVHLTVKNAAQDQKPIGSFDTPSDGSNVSGSITLTGWALDDIGVANVKIYRQDNQNLSYIGDALSIEGARPDAEKSYPNMPQNYLAGWGYMLLTYFLPNGGNGNYTLTVIVTDLSGKKTNLGSKTINVNNTNAAKPFGAIDTPPSGGKISGSSYRNSGWVLTPLPNKIPIDGSTISVYIDGVNRGHPVYNIYRADIAGLFPTLLNSGGAQAYYDFNTTAYSNGVHTIAWTATDNAGNTDGIGSRFFAIQNSNTFASRSTIGNNFTDFDKWPFISNSGTPVVEVIKGYQLNTKPQTVDPDKNGILRINIKELERVIIHFPVSPVDNLSPLPIGSTLDREKGTFYWIPGPGFIGNYDLSFTEKLGNLNQRVKIKVLPK